MAAGPGAVDHYAVLGLPSGEEGAKLTEIEISKAYKRQALKLHPDKRADDPNAHAKMQQLNSSYRILKDENSRKLFDDSLRVRPHYETDYSKWRRMEAEFQERERQRASKRAKKAAVRKDTERSMNYRRKLKEEMARNHAYKRPWMRNKETLIGMEKILLVRWVKRRVDYSEEKLRKIFSKLGEVEDVIVRPTDSGCEYCAFVVMSSEDAAADAAEVCIWGTLHVSCLQSITVVSPYEDSVINEMLKLLAKRKSKSNGGDNP